MKTITEIMQYLKEYDGEAVSFMEVCGTHTSVIAKNGIRKLLSNKIHLVSGPGCPVCVTPAAYIDKLCELAMQPNTTVATFGDMMKVKGSQSSLYEAKANGADVWILYSPLDLLKRAKQEPDRQFIMAAVGFETTTPIYALLLKRVEEEQVQNVKLLTSLKQMIPALTFICENDNEIDGFIAPGNVSAIIGSNAYIGLSYTYQKPFVVAGFTVPDILFAIYDLVKMVEAKQVAVHNLYQGVVKPSGNETALALINQYFSLGLSGWRAIGSIADSGLYLKEEYAKYDAGSLIQDTIQEQSNGCRCSEVILGKLQPYECPLFRKVCSPMNPIGPCMVSSEGSCSIYFREEQ